MSDGTRRHVFISHHHRDDDSVSKLTDLLGSKGFDVRNSSIRAKPSNQARMEKNQIPERTLKRLLRMKISWATTTVVLIGKDTHERPWVDWEIEQANKQGKRIVGVYERGGTDFEIPSALEKYASAIKGWNSDGIMAAIDGSDNSFENPDGTPRAPTHGRVTTEC